MWKLYELIDINRDTIEEDETFISQTEVIDYLQKHVKPIWIDPYNLHEEGEGLTDYLRKHMETELIDIICDTANNRRRENVSFTDIS